MSNQRLEMYCTQQPKGVCMFRLDTICVNYIIQDATTKEVTLSLQAKYSSQDDFFTKHSSALLSCSLFIMVSPNPYQFLNYTRRSKSVEGEGISILWEENSFPPNWSLQYWFHYIKGEANCMKNYRLFNMNIRIGTDSQAVIRMLSSIYSTSTSVHEYRTSLNDIFK